MHSKHHVYGTTARVDALRDAGNEPVEEDSGQDFSINGKQGYAFVISAL